MKRAIVAAATLSPAALAELKDWLGITTTGEDASLDTLLRAALETCEAFTRAMPLIAECEEIMAVCADWQKLETRPVQSISSVEGISTAGTRTTLPETAYEIDFRHDGTGWLRMLDPGLTDRVAVRFSAGMGATWASLPEGLRHGIVRLAAHQYRAREVADKATLPPAAVVALWRPWRSMRLL